MSIITNIPLWTWGAHMFGRVLSGSDWQPWFRAQALAHVEPVLGSNTRYVDVGGTTYEALQIRAVFASRAARDACVAALGTSATLTNINGMTCTAVLTDAAAFQFAPDVHAADLTFERL